MLVSYVRNSVFYPNNGFLFLKCLCKILKYRINLYTGLPFYAELISKLENNYPQALKSFNIINTPRIFTGLLETLLPLASPATRKVVKVFGHDKSEWATEILKTIASDQLTPQFGGTKIRWSEIADRALVAVNYVCNLCVNKVIIICVTAELL